jgi:cell division transport system ATP-binding protein
MILFENVTKAYGNGVVAIENLSFVVEKGEFVFLTGDCGAGKTTALKLLSMEERPTEGRVVVCGYDSRLIRRGKIALLRRKLGIISPEFGLLADRTAFENVAFAMRAIGTQERLVAPKVFDILAEIGLAHKAETHPNCLSGGEQWRLRIARAITNDPLLLLADDPFGNLDFDAASEILVLLHTLHLRGTTVLAATNQTGFIRSCTERKIHLDRGKIADKGKDVDMKRLI